MNVTINNSLEEIPDLTSLDLLMKQLEIDTKGIAIAVNLTVIPKLDWDETLLKENDKITIIKATQGG